VHAFSWVPQNRILQQADAVVTHGGINTIDETVMQGVPLLIYNGGETDMAGNAARVVYHGLGIAGDGRRDGAGDIARHIDRLIDEPSFVHNVETMRRTYCAYSENRVAESTVRRLLGRAHAGLDSHGAENRA
jgi:UDP:flavonoid glycosyltransferase YjiC (YdhE family)